MFNDISSALNFVQSSSYILIFIMMVIEGPMTTTAAALAASMGYLSIYIIFVLSLLGDITGDIIHYCFGYYFGRKVVEKYTRDHTVKKGEIKKLEDKINNNLWKSVMLIKATPPLSTPGLLLVGALRVRFSRYILASIVTTLPLTIFYTTLGYYFGFSIKQILNYFNIGRYALFFVICILVILYFLYKYIYKKIAKKLSH